MTILGAFGLVALSLAWVSALFWLLARTTRWVDRISTQDKKDSK